MVNISLLGLLIVSLTACGSSKEITRSVETTVEDSTVSKDTDEENETTISTEADEEENNFISDEVFEDADESHGISDAVYGTLDYMYSWELDYEDELEEEALYDYLCYLQGAYPSYAVTDEDYSTNMQSVWQGSGYRYGMKYTSEEATDMLYAFRWTKEGLKDRVYALMDEIEKQVPEIKEKRQKKQEEVTAKFDGLENLPEAIKYYPSYGLCYIQAEFKEGDSEPYGSYYDLSEEETDELMDKIAASDRVLLTEEETNALFDINLEDAELLYYCCLAADSSDNEHVVGDKDFLVGFHNGEDIKLYVYDIEDETGEVTYYEIKDTDLESHMQGLCELVKENLEG